MSYFTYISHTSSFNSSHLWFRL